jgi:hypothetical protein
LIIYIHIINGYFLAYIIGLDWITLLNGYKWVIGFLISNPFKIQPNPPKHTYLSPKKIEKIEKNVWKKKKE